MSRFSGISIFLVAATVLAAFILLSAIPVVAQATISTGSIQGTITDPQGAVVVRHRRVLQPAACPAQGRPCNPRPRL